jgi:hypothetical protein
MQGRDNVAAIDDARAGAYTMRKPADLHRGANAMRHATLLLILALLVAAPAAHGEWKPARGPLMTRWARDVRPDKVHPEYPRPQMVRERWQNLNGVWQLALGKEGEAAPLGKGLSEQILVPFPVESALSGVMKRARRLWYRREFTVPEGWAGQRILLHFGAVDWHARAWVNGKEVGEHKGGYDPFTFDITDALKGKGKQELVVGVSDPTDRGSQPRGKQVNEPRGIWYTPTTGIWQTVWLEPVPKSSIASLKITPDVDGKRVLVTARGRGTGEGARVKVTATADGRAVGSGTGRVGEAVAVKVPDPKLWSPASPFLYGLKVELGDGEKAADEVESYFGMRKVDVAPDDKGVPRIRLNGEFVFQVGPLDQGFWPDGLYTAPTDEALAFDVKITKKFGFNMTRKHVKVEPARWYYHCDLLGLLVWQDMPSGGPYIRRRQPDAKRSPESAAEFEKELKAMMDGLHNHPSIVTWVIFNEGWGQYDTARIAGWAKKYDPTRLIDSATGWVDRGVGDMHDIHAYPGPAAPPPDRKRALVLGEFGGLGLGVDGHTWTKKTWGYRGTSSKEDLTRKYERLMRKAWGLKDTGGLSAVVYTQITDVETEANGLMTYDREVIKVDVGRVAAVNRGDFSQVPQLRVVVPTAKEKALTWKYTTEKPGKGWAAPDFDDSGWKEGPAGFGRKDTPGARVRTEWTTDDIWVRRDFTLAKEDLGDLLLLLHHDEDAEVYLNGVLAAKVTGYTTAYEEVSIRPEAQKVLRAGKNTIAIHCKQTRGGQYIDCGLAALKKPAGTAPKP